MNARALRTPFATTLLLALGACGSPALFSSPGQLPEIYRPGPSESATPTAVQTGGPAASLPGSRAGTQAAQGGSLDLSGGPAPPVRNAQGAGLDWGLVDPAPPGVAQVGASPHGVEPTESGRLYILELYQDVLDQRDALELEVAALTTELERALTQVQAFEQRVQADENRIVALEAENQTLDAEVRDLAGRLTTAQIRRLESEKLLLESKIQWQRAVLDAAAQEAKSNTTGLALGLEKP